MLLIILIALLLVFIGYYLYNSSNSPEKSRNKVRQNKKRQNKKIQRPVPLGENGQKDLTQWEMEDRIQHTILQESLELQKPLELKEQNQTYPDQTQEQVQNQIWESHNFVQNTNQMQEQINQRPEINIIYKDLKSLTPYEKESITMIWENHLRDGEPDMGLKDNSLVFLVYDNNGGKIVGMASILILDEFDLSGHFSRFSDMNVNQNSLILYNVCIEPNYRGQGIAQEMLGDIHTWATNNNKDKIILFVKSKNIPAQRLYTKFGYKIDGNYKDPNSNNIQNKDFEYLMIRGN